MKKKILILFSVIALLCSGCGLSLSIDTSDNTSLPPTINEGLDDRTSNIVGAWYCKTGDYVGIYYMYSNGTGEFIGFEHDNDGVYTRYKYTYHPKTGLITVTAKTGFHLFSTSSTLSFSDDGNTLTSVSDNETNVFTRIE